LGLRPVPLAVLRAPLVVEQPEERRGRMRQLLLFCLMLWCWGCAAPTPWEETAYRRWLWENQVVGEYGLERGFEIISRGYPHGLPVPPPHSRIGGQPYFYEGFYYRNTPALQYNFGRRRR
jgi:hypothetical protein